MYANYPKTCILSLAICFTFACLSPREPLKVDVQPVFSSETKITPKEAKQEILASIPTGTGTTGLERKGTGTIHTNSTGTGKLQGVHENPTCDAKCKVNTLVKLGIGKHIAEPLVYECKNLAKDPVNCIRIGSFLVANESSGGKNCYNNNCYGIKKKGKTISYASYSEGVKDWISRYNKHWYNQRTPDSFYSNSPKRKPKTHYCLSERQPNGTLLNYCPNGHKHAWNFFNKLSKKF